MGLAMDLIWLAVYLWVHSKIAHSLLFSVAFLPLSRC